jgi:hypothetical protein
MKNIIFTALLLVSFSATAEVQTSFKSDQLVAKKPTDAQILQFKILKAFKTKRTFYKA